jgi:hypothetical protein
MAYIYQVRFDIDPDQMNQLEIGASLERVLAYLRALLPSQMGYISAQAMFSLNIPDRTQLIFQSIWETWDDIDAHRHSSLLEDKILVEFEPHVPLEDLTSQIYEEVA